MNKILVGLVILFSVPHANAQFSWGVRTGFQYSTLNSKRESTGYSPKLTYLVPGFYFQQQFSNNTALSVDIQYANKGFLYAVSNDSRHTLPYLTIPVLFHYKPGNTISFFAGPEFGLRLGSSFLKRDERVSDVKMFTAPYDVGVSSGISLHISPNYMIMFRYTQGLINVLDSDYRIFDNGSGNYLRASDLGYKLTNQSFQLSFSSAFIIPKGEGKKSVSFALRQGISNSTIYGSGIEQITGSTNSIVKSRAGYEAGIDMRIGIQKYFFFSTGITYLQKGGQIENNPSLKVNYVSVPLLFGVSPIATNNFTFSIEGGLGINKQIGSQNPYSNLSGTKAYPYTGSYIYGFELATKVSNKLTLFLNYRNSWDGNSFYEWDNGGTSKTYELYSKSESLSLGIRLHTNRVKKTQDVDDNNHSSIGLKAGGNFSTMVYENQPIGEASNSGIQIGAHVGMYFKIRLGKKIALTPEIVYINKQENFNTVEIPVMLSYIFPRGTSIEGGLQFGFLPSKKIRTINVYEEYITEGGDLGWNAGVKRQVSKKFAVGCRYYQSLKNITGWSESGLSVETSGSNRNLQLSAYYSFSKR